MYILFRFSLKRFIYHLVGIISIFSLKFKSLLLFLHLPHPQILYPSLHLPHPQIIYPSLHLVHFKSSILHPYTFHPLKSSTHPYTFLKSSTPILTPSSNHLLLFLHLPQIIYLSLHLLPPQILYSYPYTFHPLKSSTLHPYTFLKSSTPQL